jgi:hypothetical protein
MFGKAIASYFSNTNHKEKSSKTNKRAKPRMKCDIVDKKVYLYKITCPTNSYQPIELLSIGISF